MKIEIAQRLRPFCHLPGTSCLLPWSGWKVQIFPTLVRFHHLISGKTQELALGWRGPVKDFTVQLDLEKGKVEVFGQTEEGYRCLQLDIAEEVPRHPLERLSLGSHKALDWELVRRRQDLREILPVWYHLGQMVPSTPIVHVGTAALLQPYDKMEIAGAYLKLFLAGFEGMMVPRLSDSDHQGIIAAGDIKGSPLVLLTEGRRLIRALFFEERADVFAFLPQLPPEFHAGRFLNLQTQSGDRIDLEWSKKMVRRVVIRPGVSRDIFLHLQKPLKSLRCNGKRQTVEVPLKLEAGKTLDLDRFEK